LRRLEEKYPAELAVIGVHSGKYPAERITAHVRDAVMRLGIDHPVVNDRFFRIWRAYAVDAWPTIVLVDPRGYYMGSQPGEITFESLDPVIGAAIRRFDSEGLIDRRPVPAHPEHLDEPARPLRYPGKVLAVNGDGGGPARLFIADTDHHRIVGTRLEEDGRAATVEWIAGASLDAPKGAGTAGAEDGAFAVATFRKPQGMALVDNTLYVADSENHLIRALDLAAQQVTTVAGTGELGYVRSAGPARRTPLNSPWDLTWAAGTLYIAMAGRHQLWAFDPVAQTVQPYAGTGREALQDGSLHAASLAQPTGLDTDGRLLYFTDSEAQAVRSAGVGGGDVHTYVGTGLFDFGDKDGQGDAVRLQHPFGVAQHGETLYVADTYNSKIKRLDPRTRTVTSWLGAAERGRADGAGTAAHFNEPEGVSIAGNRLYIADTNNHAVRVVDLDDPEGRVTTVDLRDLPAL
jgi:sugar lactone lactonase YvrE